MLTREGVRIKKEGFFAVIRSKLELFPSKLYLKISTKYAVNKYASELESKLNIRRAAFQRSRELPKHSEVYTEETISGCIGKYDCYVSGSDQIWKPGVLQVLQALYPKAPSYSVSKTAPVGGINLPSTLTRKSGNIPVFGLYSL